MINKNGASAPFFMSNEELFKELKLLKISIRRMEADLGLSQNNLHKYFKNPSRTPDKYIDKLTTYLRLKKDVASSEWGKLVLENEQLKETIRSLKTEIDQLKTAATSWNELMAQHEKAIKKRPNNG